MKSRRAWGVLLLLVIGCSKEADIPSSRGRCRTTIGSTRESVLKVCGSSCGTFELGKGRCGRTDKQSGLLTFCSNSCEVYRDTALCYYGQELVSVLKLEPGSRLFEACAW